MRRPTTLHGSWSELSVCWSKVLAGLWYSVDLSLFVLAALASSPPRRRTCQSLVAFLLRPRLGVYPISLQSFALPLSQLHFLAFLWPWLRLEVLQSIAFENNPCILKLFFSNDKLGQSYSGGTSHLRNLLLPVFQLFAANCLITR
jgi:hypothetical protein